jgi:hypothetical protein
MRRAAVEMRAWDFHSTDEVFLAPSAHEAVQMWRAGYRGVLALEPTDPRELDDSEVIQGITIAQWRRLGQRGIVDRKRPGCRS